jgi:4-hydroxy-tetrahydrodipicolinate synthase
MHEMISAALAGERAKAEAIDLKLSGLHRDLFIESNPIPAKWATFTLGLNPKGIRLPLTWLSDEYQDTVRAAMVQAEVL